MNYYPFHIGDFRSGTVNMTRQERWIYRDLIDICYDAEAPLTLDMDVLCNQIGVRSDDERKIVADLLRFKFVKSEQGYRHETCDRVIADYHKKAVVAQTNGKLGGRPKKASANLEKPSGLPSGSDTVPTGNPVATGSQANQEPITNNHKPDTSTASPSSDDVRQCPAGALVDAYHEFLPNNPRVKVLSDARRSAIKARWIEASKLNCAPFGYATKAEGLAAWREFFGICAESKFLTGLSPPMPGKPAFVADIDFIFSASGFAKTLENKYHRDGP